jgi:hypothetical protein
LAVKETVTEISGRRVILMDSITSASEEDTDQIVISASHGGVSSGRFATRQRLGACFFNDAGVGKEDAGIAALSMLEEHGVPGATLAHSSARIGDARDHWEHGVVSHVNGLAAASGLHPGQSVHDAVRALAAS